jgi:hypothetical protein
MRDMGSYRFLAGALLSVAAVFPQQPGSNIVPDEAMRGAVNRALGNPLPPALTPGRATYFNIPNYPMSVKMAAGRVLTSQSQRPQVTERLMLLQDKTCAVPLLEAKGKDTNDPISRAAGNQDIDPKIRAKPRVFACAPK